MRQAALLVALLVLLTGPVAVADAQELDAADRQVTIEIRLDANGDAHWNVSARFSLDSQNETEAFQRLARDFEAGGGGTGFSITLFERAVRRVNERTDREMQVQNTAYDAYTTSSTNESGNVTRTGVLSLQFTWTNFAEVGNETISVQRVFTGSWFGDLGSSQTLIIQPPPNYQVDTAQPSSDIINGSLRWQGPQTFEPGQPSVTFVEAAEPPAGSWAVTALAALVALVVGAGAVYVWINRKRAQRASEAEEAGPGEPGAGEAAAGAPAEEAAAGSEAAAGAAETEATAETEEEGVEPELLSDEERVERLLREHGGRMKQAKIVEETRWSNAKVSQLLSSMDEEGRIEKLRIGRENLISLPGYGEDGESE